MGRWMEARRLFLHALDLRVQTAWKYYSLPTSWSRPCFGLTMESGRNRVVLASCLIHGRVRMRFVVSGSGVFGFVGRIEPSRTSTMLPVETT